MKIAKEQEMLAAGRSFAEQILASREAPQAATVIELIGDVGAGKTTFTRGLAEGLGVKEPVTSPSYTISKRYALPGGGELVHYDFYRLPDPGLMAADLAESAQDPANIVVIEWGENLNLGIPTTKITIKVLEKYREIYYNI